MNKQDHPNSAALGWKTVASERPFENKLMKVRDDRIELPDGNSTTYAYVEKGHAVIIVPVTDDGKMILVRQYRYPVDDHCLEVPAGTTQDTQDLSLEAVAAKELQEEIGGTGSK